MKRKIIFNLFIAVFSVFAFAGMAFAAQTVVLKTTVPDIPQSACYQAGTETLEVDNGTVLTKGDVIQFSLMNNVTICRSFDFYLRLHDGLAGSCAALDVSTATEPVTSTNPVADELVSSSFGSGDDYGFLVQGTVGQQTYTITVVSRDKATGAIPGLAVSDWTLTFKADPVNLSNLFIVKLFDEKFLTPYFWKDAETAPPVKDYTDDSTVTFTGDDNALCIDTLTELFTGEYVESTPNSFPAAAGIPLAFSGDYRIAHIVDVLQYVIVPCKNAVVGHIRIGVEAAQGGVDTCDAFDFETAGTGAAGTGYCTDHNANNRLILQSIGAPFVQDNYELTLQILVNGVAGDNGVYFSNTAPVADGDATLAGACALPGAAIGGAVYTQADGVTAAVPAAPVADCTIATAARAVKLVTAAHNMNLGAADYYMVIDLPPFNYNLASIAEGDVVTIAVTLTRPPCGTIGPYNIIIGTFGCALVVPNTALLYPYFTAMGSTDWWNGIAIANLGATDGTFTLYVFEQDGDQGSYLPSDATLRDVDANSMYVNLLSSMLGDMTLTAGTGTLDDSRCYVWVCTDFTSCDGFAMMGTGSEALGGSGEAQGYLPRRYDGVLYNAPALCP